MTPEERELRRALDARSGSPSPEFRARLSAALAGDRPTSNLVPGLALVAAAVLVSASVGVLVLSRHTRSLPPPVAAVSTPSPGPSPTPQSIPGVLSKPLTPIVLPNNAQLSAPSTDVVWAWVANQYLYRSVDRGRTWEQRPIPPVRGSLYQPAEISFVSDQEGWLATWNAKTATPPATSCHINALWDTADGGLTWQKSSFSSGTAKDQCDLGFSFVDAGHGFVVTSHPNHVPDIYRTGDGGVTWNVSGPLSDPPGFPTRGTGAPGTIRTFGSTLLVALSLEASSGMGEFAYSSMDGGATWNYLASAKDPNNNIDFVTESRWLELIGPGQSVETTDAGATWHRYASDYSQAAPIAANFSFADSVVGYATVRGGISRTLDGGLHWSVIRTPGTR